MSDITFYDLLMFVDSCHRDFQVMDTLAELSVNFKVHKITKNEKAVKYLRRIRVVDKSLITRYGYYRLKKRYIPTVKALGEVIKKGGEKNGN